MGGRKERVRGASGLALVTGSDLVRMFFQSEI